MVGEIKQIDNDIEKVNQMIKDGWMLIKIESFKILRFKLLTQERAQSYEIPYTIAILGREQ